MDGSYHSGASDALVTWRYVIQIYTMCFELCLLVGRVLSCSVISDNRCDCLTYFNTESLLLPLSQPSNYKTLQTGAFL